MYCRLSANISWLFQVIWLARCVLTILELNCYESFGDQEKNEIVVKCQLNVFHSIAKQVISRTNNEKTLVQRVQN